MINNQLIDSLISMALQEDIGRDHTTYRAYHELKAGHNCE